MAERDKEVRKRILFTQQTSHDKRNCSISPLERVSSWKVKENIKLKNNDIPFKLVQYLNMLKNAFIPNVTWSLQNNPVE